MTRPWPDWSDRPCVIVASGPTAREAPLDKARGLVVVAVNESWRLVPWATALYACDLRWWREAKCEFEGDRYSITNGAEKFGARLIPIRRARRTDDMVLTDPPTVATGGNSGFQAINMAVQFGSRQIVLVGFDMRVDKGLHWHGKHRGTLGNPTERSAKLWREMLEKQAPRLEAHGVDVVNASPVSALENYRKMDLESALEHFRCTAG